MILILFDDFMPTDFMFTLMPQGVEAQTLANVYLALENNLEIIPVRLVLPFPNNDNNYFPVSYTHLTLPTKRIV